MKFNLPEKFLSQYKGKNPKWGYGGLGYIVYLRTYSRTKEDGTMEQWWETCKRVTEGNFGIEMDRLQQIGKWNLAKEAELMKEAQRFYHLMFNLVITPPGRGLWMSGTKFSLRTGDAENNCWGVVARPQKFGESHLKPVIGSSDELLPSFAAIFTFDQLMKGGGVGVNVQRKNVNQMPTVKREINLHFICDPNHKDFNGDLAEQAEKDHIKFNDHHAVVDKVFKVPDSREGWAESLQLVIDSHFIGEYSSLAIDISDVRPKGDPIKGFGGIASGPAPLVHLLKVVNDILNENVGQKVSPVHWGDIIQNIGCCVVAGNVRRSALILVGDVEDLEFVESKNYSKPENLVASQWRWASNNSVSVTRETTKEEFKEMANNIYCNGEPGYTNIELAQNTGRIIDGWQEMIDGFVEIFNPCGEITLPNGSPCNLFEINLPKIHELIEKGIETEDLYKEACYLGTRYAYRVTFRKYDWEVTRKIINQQRRLGVGLTGFMDWVLMKFDGKAVLGFDENDNPIYKAEVVECLDQMYKWVKETNKLHAEELLANPSIKLTTVKPSGTVSIMMGVSAGMHAHQAPYLIRRIRFAANNPLVEILIRCNYKWEFLHKGYDENKNDIWDHGTMVFEFPIQAPTAEHPDFQTRGTISLKEQFAIQALLAKYWSDNAVSATLNFHKGTNEIEDEKVVNQIAELLFKYKDTIKSTSLLPYIESGAYRQMPEETISKERYEQEIKRIRHKPWELIDSLNSFDDSDDVVGECQGGHCPIK
ncbi:ribonucleoside-triphosphate reductase, adenosylcobalamin-dependent [Thermoactinomyces daqus]|uniref:Adenosylcobalamin-dependent ribonucleoside-triphosphate reductase n=1 Tax=Thermoactinomyces daqus TaxID=1329516 RepID=A0A7W1XAB2_9BACL|nr:ribonucleoside-triphosphate reductase, adenosylcobalamin-dependent [Thermoactinomyces daqus]MBA4542930.1 ribonucleoside-triphosphate reductase, adenosylcobalamin-dependent [Thermoactinomyces daqus]